MGRHFSAQGAKKLPVPTGGGAILAAEIEFREPQRSQPARGGMVQQFGCAAFRRARGHGRARETAFQGLGLPAKIGQPV